jgi:O-antigen/teichoic acid export membrane protein
MTRLEITGKLLTRNTLLNFVGQAGPLLVTVATVPYIIRGLGVERFGLLSIAWVLLEYFIVFDLGLGRATTKYMAEALGKGNKDQIPRLAWTTLMVQVVLGLVGTVIVFSITPLLAGQILNIPPALLAEAKAIFFLLALSVPLVLVSTSLTGILSAAQRFDLVNAVGASLSIANSVSMVVGVLYFDWHLTEIVTILVAFRFLAVIANYWLCAGIFPAFKALPRFHRAELRTLFAFGSWVTVSSVVVPLLLYLDRFVIGATLTLAAVAYYSVPYDIVTRLWIIPLSAITALFPAFSTLTGQGHPERIASLLSQSVKWVLLSVGPAVVIITAFSRDILQLWLGADFAQESTLAVQILAVAILVNSIVQVPYTLIQALGRPDLTAKFHLVQLPVHGFLVWWLVSQWGIIGAALAQGVRIAFEALLFFAAASRLVSWPFSSFVSDRIVQSLLFFFLFIGLVIGINNLPLVLWLRLLALGVVLSAVVWTVWRYSLGREARDELVKLLRPVTAK